MQTNTGDQNKDLVTHNDVNLKSNINNIDNSTEQSDIHKQSEDLNKSKDFNLANNEKTEQKKDVFTPNVSKTKAINEHKITRTDIKKPLVKEDELGTIHRHFKSESKSNLPKTDINTNNNLFENIKPTNEGSYIENKEVVNQYKPDMGEQTSEANSLFYNQLMEAKQNLKTEVMNITKNLDAKFANLSKTAKTTFNKLKIRTQQLINLTENHEYEFPDLERSYTKLNKIRNDYKLSDKDKIEAAIRELDKMPLDPAHLHDIRNEQSFQPIGNQNINENSLQETPQKSTEDLIHEQEGITAIKKIPQKKESSSSIPQKIDKKAFSKIENSFDYIKQTILEVRDHLTNNKIYEMKISETEKMTDPIYKRAEAIRDILEDRGLDYAKITYYNNESVSFTDAALTSFDNLKAKISVRVSELKDSSSEFLETLKTKLEKATSKAKEGTAKIEKAIKAPFCQVNQKKTSSLEPKNDMTTVKQDKNRGFKSKQEVGFSKAVSKDTKEQVQVKTATVGSNTNVLSSHLDITKSKSFDVYDLDLEPKKNAISDIELKAQHGNPDLSKMHKYK